jgi:hypothetical protein
MSQRPSLADGRTASHITGVPLALRVARVDTGRVLWEHVVLECGAVRGGIIEANDVRPGALTFEVAGDRVILRGEVRGKIRQGREVLVVATNELELRLHDQGRLVVEGTVLLVQVIVPPSLRKPPGLPASMRNGATLDARFTAIAMASLLAHFMFVVVLENVDPAYVSAAVLPPHTVAFMMEAPELPPVLPPIEPSLVAPDEGDNELFADATTTPSHPTSPRSPSTRGPSVAPADTARLAEEMGASVSAGILAALDPSALSTGSSSAGSIMAGMEAGPTGTAVSATTLATRSGGGTVDPGGLGHLAGTHESGAVGEGEAIVERDPVGVVRPTGLIDEPSPGLLAPRVVNARVRERMPAIRQCYSRELRDDPTVAGRLEVSFSVQMTGQVNEVRVVEDTIGSPRMAECVTRVFAGMRRFSPGPEDGMVRFTYPLVFVPGS